MSSPLALSAAQLLPGLILSRVLILGSTLVRRLVRPGVRTQAFTWINSASAAGIALAAAFTGYLSDTQGARSVFDTAVLALLISAVMANAVRRPVVAPNATTATVQSPRTPRDLVGEHPQVVDNEDYASTRWEGKRADHSGTTEVPHRLRTSI